MASQTCRLCVRRNWSHFQRWLDREDNGCPSNLLTLIMNTQWAKKQTNKKNHQSLEQREGLNLLLNGLDGAETLWQSHKKPVRGSQTRHLFLDEYTSHTLRLPNKTGGGADVQGQADWSVLDWMLNKWMPLCGRIDKNTSVWRRGSIVLGRQYESPNQGPRLGENHRPFEILRV